MPMPSNSKSCRSYIVHQKMHSEGNFCLGLFWKGKSEPDYFGGLVGGFLGGFCGWGGFVVLGVLGFLLV